MRLSLLYEMSVTTGDIAAMPIALEVKPSKSKHLKLGVDDPGSVASFVKTSSKRGKSVSIGGDRPPQSWGRFKSTETLTGTHKKS